MREIRQSGSEGGVAGNGHPYPYLESARVRLSLWREPAMQPDEPPRPTRLLGRDRSPSGPCPQTLHGDDYFPQPVASRKNVIKEEVFRE